MKRLVSFALVATCVACAPAHAAIDAAGTAAATFLSVGTGPAVLGMGGAALGRAGSLDLAAWNPAALGFVGETSLQIAHATLDDQTVQEWATMGGRFGKSHTRWGLSALYQNDGTFDGRDASNLPTGSFTVANAAGIVQLAQSFGSHVAVGFAGKYVVDSQGPYSRGSGTTFDLGVTGQAGMFGFGFAAQNVLGKMRYGATSYPFPSNVGVGVSVTHPSGVTAALDVNMPSTSYTNVRSGVEWAWKQHVALRAGYRADLGAATGSATSGPTFGAGMGAHGVWLDYGFLLTGEAGGQHRIALSLHPSKLGWGDPYGQSEMPKEFDNSTIEGPPTPPPPRKK